MCLSNTIYVAASLLLTLSFLGVGISFFGPYWISNLSKAINETDHADPKNETYLPFKKSVSEYPDRGLWAQCGHGCLWFWNDDYRLQKHLLNPLEWHISTQVIYFIAALMIAFAELYARFLLCNDDKRKRNFYVVAVVVLVSAILQLVAVAVFGGGASKAPYNVITDPTKFSDYLGQAFDKHPVERPYLSWCYWMAVTADMLSVVTGAMFLLAACCVRRDILVRK